MSLRSLGQADASEALPWLWWIGGGVALIAMLGNWVRRERPHRPVRVDVDASTYVRDSAGVANVRVRVEARSDAVRLSGCPAPPVLVFQLRAGDRWVDHLQVNRPCQPKTVEERVDLIRGQAVTSVVPLAVPGHYRVGLAAGRYQHIQWIPGDEFTVR